MLLPNIMKKLLPLLVFLIAIAPLSAQHKDQVNITAKFGKGIRLMAADSSVSMKLNFRMQSLAYYTHDLNSMDESGDFAFLMRRARIKASGFVLSPRLKYKVELGLTNRDLESNQTSNDNPGTILDMVLKWQFARNFELWFGQTKLPGNRERIISSANLQFVDRSIINSKFTTDRDAGFWLRHQAGKKFIVRNALAITAGEGKNRNTGKNKNTAGGGLSYSYRLEMLPMGAFSNKGDYFEGDLAREAKPKLALGLAYNFNHQTTRAQGQLGSYFIDGDNRDIHTVFADYIFKVKGFSWQGEYAYKHADNAISIDPEAPSKKAVYVLNGWGINNQVSYMFKNNIELAGRFSYIQPDAEILSLRPMQRDYTLGISKYVSGHKLKVQADLTYSSYGTGNTLGGRFQVEVQI